jgi:flagellar export protein FliJ
MRPFRFPLEALRTLRERQERSALESYARCVQASRAATERLQAASDTLDRLASECRAPVAAGLAAAHVRQLRAFCATAAVVRTECQRAVASAQRDVQRAWELLVVARQQREAVERYYQRLQQQHLRHEQRAEQKVLDEMAQRRLLLGELNLAPSTAHRN